MCNGSGIHQNCRTCKATGFITETVKQHASKLASKPAKVKTPDNSNNTDKINEAFQKGYQAGFAAGLAHNQAGGDS